MINWLNKFTQTLAAKILIGLIGFSFLGFGLSGVLTSITQSNISKVGDQKISAQEFQSVYINQLNNYTQRSGRQLTPQEALALGIPSQVMLTLQNQAAQDQIVENYNLGQSDKYIAESIADNPAFRGLTGAFDPSLFVRTLQNAGISEKEYKISQRNFLAREQVTQALFSLAPGALVPSEIAKRYASEQRTIEFFKLTDINIPTPPSPTEEEIKTYLSENQTDFRAPEQRAFEYINLTVAALAKPDLVGDDQISEYFEERKATFFTPATRVTEQIVLNDPAVRLAFEEGLAANRAFDDIVIELNLSDRILAQTITRSLGGPANDTEKTVFATAVGEFGFVDLALGRRVIKVASETASEQKSLADVSDQIRRNIAEGTARNQLVDSLDEIEEMRASGQSLADIVKQVSLPLASGKIAASGEWLEGEQPVTGIERLVSAVLDYKDGGLAPMVAVNSSNTLWFDVGEITPERDLTLAEATDEIRTKLETERTAKALADASADVMKRLDGGEDINAVAAEFSAFAEISTSFGRKGGTTVLSNTVVDATFGGGEGYIGNIVDTDGSSVFFRVVSLDPAGDDAAEPEVLAALIENIEASNEASLRSQYLSGLKESFGTSLNAALLQQILALDAGQ